MDDSKINAILNHDDLDRVQRQLERLNHTLKLTFGSQSAEKELDRIDKQLKKIDLTTKDLFSSLKKNLSVMISTLAHTSESFSLSISTKGIEDGMARIEKRLATLPDTIAESARQWLRFESAINHTMGQSAFSSPAALGGKGKAKGVFLFCLPADASTCRKTWVCAA